MVGIVQLIVMMGAAPFMDRAGRRIMLIVSGLGTSACLLLLGVALYHVGGGVDKQDYLHPLEGSNLTVQTASATVTPSEQGFFRVSLFFYGRPSTLCWRFCCA